MGRLYYVYIVASERNGTLYVGVTNDLSCRIEEYSSGTGISFTKKYGIHALVYYETAENVMSAITREKQLKFLRRKRKLAIIDETNPEWKDLAESE
jgi:putative endonuclease